MVHHSQERMEVDRALSRRGPIPGRGTWISWRPVEKGVGWAGDVALDGREGRDLRLPI